MKKLQRNVSKSRIPNINYWDEINFRDETDSPYACTFADKSSWLRQLKAIERSFTLAFFFISNLGFCLELGLLNSETEIGTVVA